MPIVVAQQIKKFYVDKNFSNTAFEKILFLLSFDDVASKYKHICIVRTSVNVYLSRIFNEEGEAISEPRLFSSLKLIFARPYSESDKTIEGYPQANGFYLDFDDLANKLSIPDGYFVELLLTTFVNELYGEKVIFPYETRVNAFKLIEGKVKERIGILNKIGSITQSHGFLSELGLEDVARELSQGFSRFEIGDYDGAIKSYRKVVEGFRNHLEEKETKEGGKVFKRLIDNSKNRTEKIIDFLNKTYSLLSNFGEHYGTHAFEEEGMFANKIVEDLTEYLTKKLRKK